MQPSKKTLFLLILFSISSILNLSAQNKKLVAEVKLIDKQRELLDSVFVNGTLFFDEDEYPVFDQYSEEWNSTVVDPYHINISQFPDSILIDCSDYYPPIENVVTSPFGPRWGRFHSGTDFRLKVGDSIHVAFDGKVRITKYGSGYGYYVVVRHRNGLETLYAHLSKMLVKVGDEVKAGDVIALGGNTGRSTGPHLHFETRFLGKAINPADIIDFENHVPYNDHFMVYKDKTFEKRQKFDSGRSQGRYYTVRSGDTLSKIAKRYGTTVQRICKLNGISTKTVLRPGRRLRCS